MQPPVLLLSSALLLKQPLPPPSVWQLLRLWLLPEAALFLSKDTKEPSISYLMMNLLSMYKSLPVLLDNESTIKKPAYTISLKCQIIWTEADNCKTYLLFDVSPTLPGPASTSQDQLCHSANNPTTTVQKENTW